MHNVLEFDSIELTLENRNILSSVYVKCETGKIIGLLGRNGSGKSCLLKIVFGSMSSDFQSIRLNGMHLQRSASQRVLTYLPQENLIPSSIKLIQAIKFFRLEASSFINDFPDMETMLNYTPKQLSGGWVRIFEVMLILKSNALFSFLDEPFSGIMPVHVEKLMTLIQKEKDRKGILITDHLHRQIVSISDELYVLANGQTYPAKDHSQLVRHGYLA